MSSAESGVTVNLYTARGFMTEVVSNPSPLATDDAIVDMARKNAGVSMDDFVRGEVDQ